MLEHPASDRGAGLAASGRRAFIARSAYFAPLLRLIFRWIALMCAFRVLALPNATPLQ